MSIRENVEAVRETIRDFARRVGRSEDDITLVGVTKTVSPDRMMEAAEAGIRIFGENRVQEAVAKQDDRPWPAHIQWHFIGHLQRNKVRMVVPRFQMVQSVDSVPLATSLDRQCRTAGLRMPVLLEVNLGGEQTKSGVDPHEVDDAARKIDDLEFLELRGLMAIPPYSDEPEDSRPYFGRLKALFDGLQKKGLTVSVLSMGMSHDFGVAIEEGATMVRVGTALFGKRPIR